MINPNDSIRFANVLSRKYRFHYLDMNEALEDFLHDIGSHKGTVRGPLFYSIHNIPSDEVINAEFYMPMEEDWIEPMADMRFHSFYSIENMISLCIAENLEVKTEAAYKLLFEYMKEYSLEQATPIFHVISGDENFQYSFIKIGVI
ncbi:MULTISPECIES: DUF5085 family protein [Bacillaceae]|uniref:DUF5085 family protein n=1 Tax=Bacillaceae TaxID=186817 RepID=UPI001187AB55|nr:DUF5085 family protein [Bacillus sp. S3]QCJ44246.1 DUF5085 family protein [Bacillus sp. S3]